MRKLLPLLMLAAGCRGEPERIVVQHILVSFAGATRSQNKRSKEDAEKLAKDVLRRARGGESFEALMKAYSDDPGPGQYRMSNHGVATVPPPGEEFHPRNFMVPSFGDLGFKLEIDEIALAVYHPEKSPFGWHILKRVK